VNNTKTIKNDIDKTFEHEDALATELEIVTLLKQNPDIFVRHPELLISMRVPHASGVATSLIERQVEVLRQQLKNQDDRLRDLVKVARDNERLALTRHHLAVGLLSSKDLDDVISLLLDTFSNELDSDYAEIRLFTDNETLCEQSPERYILKDDPTLAHFKTMLEQRSIICGKPMQEQKTLLFGDRSESVLSAAIIPLAAGSNLGLMGLGACKASRFTSAMGTDFLGQVGEMASTAIARYQ
jgi:uncharacterized protein YigA (DUF484 family)